MAVGGELKADKCAYKVHNMVPDKNGTWEYQEVTKGNEENGANKGRTELLTN